MSPLILANQQNLIQRTLTASRLTLGNLARRLPNKQKYKPNLIRKSQPRARRNPQEAKERVSNRKRIPVNLSNLSLQRNQNQSQRRAPRKRLSRVDSRRSCLIQIMIPNPLINLKRAQRRKSQLDILTKSLLTNCRCKLIWLSPEARQRESNHNLKKKRKSMQLTRKQLKVRH